MDAEVEITVGDVRYLLIPNKENFLSDFRAKRDAPELFVAYATTAGQDITASSLREFRSNVLDRDDVFRPEFSENVVFVGAKEEELNIAQDALDELEQWGWEGIDFVEGSAPPGPYVLLDGRTWQPWRVYYDFNACFMTSFKPSPDDPSR